MILNEIYTGVNRGLICVFPAIVAEDTSKYLALYHPFGHTFANSDVMWPGGTRGAMPVEDRVRVFLKWKPEIFREETSTRHVLYIEPHGAMHAIWLFWDSDWSLTNWYVNLQAPYVRTEAGVQITDYYLDLEITPDLQWRWKDDDEFSALCRLGCFTPDQERMIRAEGEMMARRVEAREWPFNEPWPDWRPDPSWPVPKIGDYWTSPIPK